MVVNRKQKMCMIFHHAAFDEEVYYVEQWITLKKEFQENYKFGDKESASTMREVREVNYWRGLG